MQRRIGHTRARKPSPASSEVILLLLTSEGNRPTSKRPRRANPTRFHADHDKAPKVLTYKYQLAAEKVSFCRS